MTRRGAAKLPKPTGGKKPRTEYERECHKSQLERMVWGEREGRRWAGGTEKRTFSNLREPYKGRGEREDKRN